MEEDGTKKTSERLRTSVTKEELANGVKDEFGVIYSHDGTRLLKAPSELYDYEIKEGTKVICRRAFNNCIHLTSLLIPLSVIKVASDAFELNGGIILDKLKTPLNVFSKIRFCLESREIIISDIIDEIPPSCFMGLKNLVKIVLPSTIIKIGDRAFYGCISLKEVNLPNILTDLGEEAFDHNGLEKIHLPENLTVLKKSTFRGCWKLKEINLPSSLKEIEDMVFDGCHGLKEITLSDEVQIIGCFSFRGCHNLEIINLPESLKKIGDGAFEGCHKLKIIHIPSSVINIGKGVFKECHCSIVSNTNSYKEKDGWFWETATGYLIYCRNSEKNLRVPDEIKILDSNSFDGNQSFVSIILPDSIQTLGESVFERCRNLESISLSNSLKEIPKFSFRRCDNLKEITLPNSISIIEDGAFARCKSLVKFTITKSIQKIGSGVFEFCDCEINSNNPDFITRDGLLFDNRNGKLLYCKVPDSSNLHLPDDIKELDKHSFDGLNNIECLTLSNEINELPNEVFSFIHGKVKKIIIPNSIKEIKKDTFKGFYSLENIIIPNSVIRLGDNCFEGCTHLKEINIPTSVNDIGSGCFKFCKELKEIHIPKNIGNLKDDTFNGCESLEKVIFPDSVISIGKNAFKDCSSLISINLPESLTSIEEQAFRGCSKLEDIYLSASLKTIGNGAFSGGGIKVFKSKSNQFIFSNGLLIDKDNKRLIFGCGYTEDIKIPDDIKEIGEYAFEKQTFKYIELGKNVERIYNYAFKNCSNLEGIIINHPICFHGGDNIFEESYNIKKIIVTSNDQQKIKEIQSSPFLKDFKDIMYTQNGEKIPFDSQSYISIVGAGGECDALLLRNNPASNHGIICNENFIILKKGRNLLTIEEYPALKFGFMPVNIESFEEGLDLREYIHADYLTLKISHIDFSHFDSSEMTSMDFMFVGADLNPKDLDSLDTSSVTSMDSTFLWASFGKNAKINFNTSNVTNMEDMFRWCDVEELDLSSFDVRNVENLCMFAIPPKKLILDGWNLPEDQEPLYLFDDIVDEYPITISLKGCNKFTIKNIIEEFVECGYLNHDNPVKFILDNHIRYKIYEDGEVIVYVSGKHNTNLSHEDLRDIDIYTI